MTKFHLNRQDQQRMLYWYHLAFKEKEPSNEDGETLKKILTFAHSSVNLVEDVDENDEWWQQVLKTANFTSFQLFFGLKMAIFTCFLIDFRAYIPCIIQNRFKKDYVGALLRGFRMGNKNSTTRHYCNKCGLKNNKCKCEKLK